jgi:hypothetical protein
LDLMRSFLALRGTPCSKKRKEEMNLSSIEAVEQMKGWAWSY